VGIVAGVNRGGFVLSVVGLAVASVLLADGDVDGLVVATTAFVLLFSIMTVPVCVSVVYLILECHRLAAE
jgi:hypothetical protein